MILCDTGWCVCPRDVGRSYHRRRIAGHETRRIGCVESVRERLRVGVVEVSISVHRIDDRRMAQVLLSDFGMQTLVDEQRCCRVWAIRNELEQQ